MKRRSLSILITLSLSCAVTHAGKAPLEWLDFSLTPQQVATVCQDAQTTAQGRLARLAALKPEQATFIDTAKEFDDIEGVLDNTLSSPSFLKYVSTDKAVRDAAHDCEVKTDQFTIDIYTREDLYKTFKAFADKKESLPETDQRLLDKILLEFRRNGLDLDAEKRAEIKKLKQELADVEATFGKNLNEQKDFLAVTADELKDMPADYIGKLEKTEDGKLKITLSYPDYVPFMENVNNPALRRALEHKYNTRGGQTNKELLENALNLRQHTAELLGYKDHASYALTDNMAKDPATVLSFLEKLSQRLRVKSDKELAAMLTLKKKTEKSAEPIQEWDRAFYHNLTKKTRYAIDEEAIKEYFPMAHVTDEMLAIYQEILGVRFQEVSSGPKWHPDVKLFAVRDKEGDVLLGYFYMDLYPREGKYSHAAAFNLVRAYETPDFSYQRPVAAMVANFNKPTPTAPSLLKHSEVETYFHEFGHIMHQMLTRSKYGRFSGTNVARDFVEAPSQMLENWIWEENILARLSQHYKDPSKKLPKKILQKMIEAKNLDSGINYLRQVFFATVDMTYHTTPQADSTTVWRDLSTKIRGIPMSEGTLPQAGFGHLLGGYDAGYYGYLWSEVYSADMFTRFQKAGLLDPKTGGQYRKLILEPGRSVDEMGQLRRFLGREPDENAFLKQIGLSAN